MWDGSAQMTMQVPDAVVPIILGKGGYCLFTASLLPLRAGKLLLLYCATFGITAACYCSPRLPVPAYVAAVLQCFFIIIILLVFCCVLLSVRAHYCCVLLLPGTTACSY
jgi:hypothetical protein